MINYVKLLEIEQEQYKRCETCKDYKSLVEFSSEAEMQCRPCKKLEDQKYKGRYPANRHKDKQAYSRKFWLKYRELIRTNKDLWSRNLVASAKERAKAQNLPFDITAADVPIPERCPVLGIVLKRNVGKVGPDSASVDRIEPSRGYVRGNVIVVSHRVNVLKSNASIEELTRIGLFYSSLSKKVNGS